MNRLLPTQEENALLMFLNSPSCLNKIQAQIKVMVFFNDINDIKRSAVLFFGMAFFQMNSGKE